MKKIILAAVVILVVFFFVSNQRFSCRDSNNSAEMDSLETEIGIGKIKLDSLDSVIQNTPKPQPEVIEKIKVIHDKEIQHIRNLPDDSAFIFFSDWVTKTDSSGF